MAPMVSAAPGNLDMEILVPPSGQVKLKDKKLPVIDQVSKSGGVNGTAFCVRGRTCRTDLSPGTTVSPVIMQLLAWERLKSPQSASRSIAVALSEAPLP